MAVNVREPIHLCKEVNKFYTRVMSPIRQSTGTMWSVGEIAERLGLPASTLRTWERRYGMGPTARTPGGHRRYVESDVARLEHLSGLVSQGIAPAEAARIIRRSEKPAEEPAEGEAEFVDAVIAAAREYDAGTLRTLFTECFDRSDIPTAWTQNVVPALRRVGEEWAAGELGVGGEHLVSESLQTALRARANVNLGSGPAHRTVLLASAENDQHSLPLLALEASLADEGVLCHTLGARTPAATIAGVMARVDPAAVFLWASMGRSVNDSLSRVITTASERATVVLGGPGWKGVDIGGASRCHSLAEAVEAIRASLVDA